MSRLSTSKSFEDHPPALRTVGSPASKQPLRPKHKAVVTPQTVASLLLPEPRPALHGLFSFFPLQFMIMPGVHRRCNRSRKPEARLVGSRLFRSAPHPPVILLLYCLGGGHSVTSVAGFINTKLAFPCCSGYSHRHGPVMLSAESSLN